ncbi:hypothetical protein [Helicobacter ailurogastricus]|uniref:hypothetical protein n=1 Tax=Helicobacter ailurogastricus TaxID=1578720 RepID=UPI00131555BF|nr:hypothetical protein [Helicobacter ailurogastricus]
MKKGLFENSLTLTLKSRPPEGGAPTRYRLNFKQIFMKRFAFLPKIEIFRQNARKGFLPLFDMVCPLVFSLPPKRGLSVLPRFFLRMSFDTALLAFFCGCMRVYKPVYVPTQCNIPKLERPSLSSP